MTSSRSFFRGHGLLLILTWVFLTFSLSAEAAPLSKEEVPDPLKPWVGWVLHGNENGLCPYLEGEESERICVWPARLDLSIEEKSGRFSQQWRVYGEGWVPLPGDEERWPQGVKVNGQSAAVVLHDEEPSLYLKEGQYTLTGAFEWDSLPESFQIPPETGVLSLTVNGKAVDFPRWDEEGSLWLQKEATEDKEEDRLEIRVHRKMTDDIPFVLTTLVQLDVSGKTREVVLGKALPDNFTPMSLESPLPARIEQDGKLRVQIKPGNWKIELKARHLGPVSSLSLAPSGENWAAEEVWVFDARNDLRLVSVEGVPAIDPQQTTLPDDWKKLPAYRVKPGETVKLAEKRRGDSDPAPDNLSLHRELWLDFDGGGYTLHDRISGTLSRSSRLEMNPPTQLGRVSVDDKDQFITNLPNDPRVGIEVRQGRIEVSADSRLQGKRGKIPAVSWNHDFQKVSGALNLPPGWRIFSVSGADKVPYTWVDRWTLLDLFLVLIAFLIFLKLWGKKWGIIALITLVLTFTEKDAPQWLWLAVLGGFALLRVLPAGRIHSIFKFYKIAALILLIAFSIPFMIHQVRVGLYPVLEHPYQTMEAQAVFPSTGSFDEREGFAKKDMDKGKMMEPNVMAPAPPPKVKQKMAEDQAVGGAIQEEIQQKAEIPDRKMAKEKVLLPSSSNLMLSKRGTYSYQTQLNLQEQRPGTKVQTGPGLPHWQWNRFHLQWNGPVEKTQVLRLILIPPAMNLCLAFLRVLLLTLVILFFLGFPGDFWPSFLKNRLSILFIPLFLAFSVFSLPNQAYADFPSPDLLSQLREKLLQNPECFPDCASISRMQLEVKPGHLTARLEINAQAHTAVPLPGGAKEWLPTQISVDGQGFAASRRSEEGQLWLQLTPGVYQVVIGGPLPEQETVQISLPLKPYRLDAKVEGWTLSGLHEDGQVDDNIQLTRNQVTAASETRGAKGTPTSSALPPFVRVERHLVLGLNWEVITRVERLTPTGTSIVVEIPLLEGESVTTADMRVEKGKLLVSMAPQSSEMEWRSVLSEREKIFLKAPESTSWTEVWILDVSPVWHVKFVGIPVIHQHSEGKWLPEWRPWPGEDVTIEVSRPEGIVGQTLTIDHSFLVATPGLRFTESTLSLNLRSSLGGQHILTLPEKAELQSVSINGTVQPIRQDQRKVTIPVVPGAQGIELKWQQSGGIKTLFRSPEMSLGTPSVNSEIQIKPSDNRWILFTGGPRMGPVILFWSLLVVLLLIAIGLSRVSLTPLKIYHWVLLGIGLSQFPDNAVVASLIVAGWLLMLGWRQKKSEAGKAWFNLRQLIIVGWTLVAIVILCISIHQGLLGYPDMQIAGNGSSYSLLRWFQDRSAELLPRPWVFSIPLFYYRLAMLAWALWIAWALLNWLRWGWRCFGEGGLWKPFNVTKKGTK